MTAGCRSTVTSEVSRGGCFEGNPQPGGQKRVFLNLCTGLNRIGVPYRVNDYRHARSNPSELVCIVGKPHVLDKVEWKNPILFGAAVHSHPCDDPGLLRRLPVKKVLVPGPWMKRMCEPDWGEAVEAWPVGIDTQRWRPMSNSKKTTDVLLYDKIRWDHDRYAQTLIDPIRAFLRKRGHTFSEMRYGFYREQDFQSALACCRTLIFLCEHETQGIAYQQALSSGVPILAWDRGGFWQDPAYYPHRVQFTPVSSVPYWDERCGKRFASIGEFETAWGEFWQSYQAGRFGPQSYIRENLTLEKCAQHYVRHVRALSGD